MLRSLVQTCLRYRVAVFVAAVVLLVAGVYYALDAPLDVFPEFAPPLVEIQTEAPGLSSEAVEQIVTFRLESALHGIPRMTTIRSKSVQGLSSIQCLFERGVDVLQAQQLVEQRLRVAAAQLPKEMVGEPIIMPPLSSTSRVIKVGLVPKPADQCAPGERPLSQTEISVLMKWVIEPALRQIDGVGNVSTYGLHDLQYQVLIKPEDLRGHGVTLRQIKEAVKDSVAYGSAGFHDTKNQRLPVQIFTRIDRPEDLARTVVDRRQGQPLLLGQVATVTAGNAPFIGEGVINDQAGLLVVVEKYPWANTLQVTRDVERKMEILKPGLPGVAIHMNIFRPASFIELALGNLKIAMIIGCVLVAAIVFAFLFDWRTAAISLTAIPLSIVAAVVALRLLGGTINTMVLAGLAIAIGEVVDDAIIDVENIVRRLRLNREAAEPRSAFRVVLEASLEVRSAVVYATFIVIFVCLPIFFMGGVAGSFFRPLALAYIIAVLASLVVALTVTPAMALMLLPKAVEKSEQPPLARLVRRIYRRILPTSLARPVLPLGLVGVLIVAAAVLAPSLKEEYLPRFLENDFLMHWVAKPGTSIEAMTEDIKKVGKEMIEEKAVVAYGSHIARAEAGEEVVGSNFAELWVSLGDFQGDHAAARRKIEAIMARHPGFDHDLLTYLQERIKEVLSGASGAIVLRIYGADLAVLRDKAQKVRQALEQGDQGQGPVPGIVDLRVEPQVLVPQLELKIDVYQAQALGLNPKNIFDSVTTLLNPTKVGRILQDQKAFDLVIWGHPDVRKNLADLNRLEIDLPSGLGTVPLGQVAVIKPVNAPNTIRHVQGSRCIDVTCNVRGQDLGAVVREIERRIEPHRRQEGYAIELLGEYQARAENQQQLLLVGLVSLLGIALLLYMDFQSLRLTFLVLATLPFALIGGVAAVSLTGGVLSLGSLVGFITVLGITARNGIMMVSHYRHLQFVEGMKFDRELILKGAEERVAPILMTALAAGLGLLPLAISGNKPGYEVEYPMAVVILGGLFTSTLLNLLVVPVLYEKFARNVPPPEEEEID